MAKLFKTISLEERLKASLYNEMPHLPKPTKEIEAIQLKLTPDAKNLNSILLKQTAKRVGAPALPLIDLFKTSPMSSIARPFVNTKFRSAINLSDRLKQTKLETTAHLAQYFLSDQYTDYIKITPFGIFNHTSTIQIQPVAVSLAQGGLDPVIPTFNSATAQGLIYSNGTYSSFINVSVPTYDSLILQGTFYSNGAYASFTQTTLSVLPQYIAQGPGVDPTPAISQQAVFVLQGLIPDQSNNLTSPINPATPINIPISVPASIVITQPGITPNQGGVDPTAFVFEPERTSPVLNVLGYSADRALAFFAPTVKHGSAVLMGTQFATTFKPNQGEAPTTLPPIDGKYFDYKSSQISPLLSGLLDDSKAEDVLMVWVDWQYGFVKPVYKGNDTKRPVYQGVQYIKVGNNLVINPNRAITDAMGGTTAEIQELVRTRVNFPKPVDNNSLASYKALSYDQITKRANDPSVQRPDFRKDLGITVKGGTSVNNRGTNSAAQNDFVTLSIASMTGGGSVKFRAFITSFSDGFSVSWNDINYVGRQDTLKAFKGVTRAGSLAFKVAAFNKADLGVCYSKLSTLAKIAAVGGSLDGGKYISGPLCKITVGNWFTNTPCVFNSVKYDIQMADYSWDIDEEVPQLVDVSVDFAILGDVSGKPLNSGTNKYFNFG